MKLFPPSLDRHPLIEKYLFPVFQSSLIPVFTEKSTEINCHIFSSELLYRVLRDKMDAGLHILKMCWGSSVLYNSKSIPDCLVTVVKLVQIMSDFRCFMSESRTGSSCDAATKHSSLVNHLLYLIESAGVLRQRYRVAQLWLLHVFLVPFYRFSITAESLRLERLTDRFFG